MHRNERRHPVILRCFLVVLDTRDMGHLIVCQYALKMCARTGLTSIRWILPSRVIVQTIFRSPVELRASGCAILSIRIVRQVFDYLQARVPRASSPWSSLVFHARCTSKKHTSIAGQGAIFNIVNLDRACCAVLEPVWTVDRTATYCIRLAFYRK